MPEVCAKWQMIAGKVIGLNPMTYFECTAPQKPLEPLNMSAPAGMKSNMRWRNVLWPTEDVAACKTQGARMLNMRDMKAGETIKEDGFRCIDAKTGETQVDFSVLRSCLPDKDPHAPGSCKSEVIENPRPVTPAAPTNGHKPG